MNDQLNKTLNELGLSELLSLFEGQDIDDSVLGELSDADLKDIGIDKLGTRKKLLAAFGKSGGGAVAVSEVEASTTKDSGGATSKTAATPAEATKDSPWINTLGMPFVPIPRFETRFCIWPVRVQDYEAYCMASGAKFPEIPFPQESDHPIVGVSWNDAIEFCIWLTGKERGEGKIDDKTVYRLPIDLEWSAAVGLPHEPEASPAERHLKAPGYPWGLRWPPPQNTGNYEHTRKDQLGFAANAAMTREGVQADIQWHSGRGRDMSADKNYMSWLQVCDEQARVAARWKSEWRPVDDFEYTSPVATFADNALGIYDLGGNVWEWVMDEILVQGNPHRVARGASFATCPQRGLSDERQVKFGYVHYGDIGRADEAQTDFLTIENAKAYASSFRHFNPEDSTFASTEYEAFLPNESSKVPCGGVRIVAVSH